MACGQHFAGCGEVGVPERADSRGLADAVASAGLERFCVGGVTLVGRRTGTLRFGFTERTGGMSRPPFSSLNLGGHVGDDPVAVEGNRLRALEALGAGAWASNLLVPNQVHGDHVVTVESAAPEVLDDARMRIAAGADAIVCTAPHVPVLLCFADCVPVILACEGAFAVVHSGWKGTYARIAAKAACELSRAAHVAPDGVHAYIGPHIQGGEYEVSSELMQAFEQRFGAISAAGARLLDLSACIRKSLIEAGVPAPQAHELGLSTVSENDRFFSFRAEKGACGRHGAIACIC